MSSHTDFFDAAHIAILYALPDERKFFGSEYQPMTIGRDDVVSRVASDPGRPAPNDTSALTLCIGIGIDNALRNASLLLESAHPVRALIVVGFAGGLDKSLSPGSVVVGDVVSNTVSQQEYRPNSKLLAAAAVVQARGFQAYRGRIATTGSVLVRASAKQEFARATGAIAVDMESAGAAAAAAKYGVPWLAVRVITDGVDEDLPLDFNALADHDGAVNRSRIVAHTLSHPWKIPALIRLGMRSSLAAGNLAAFLQPLLRQIPGC